MKRMLALALALIFCVGVCLLSACGKDEEPGEEAPPSETFEPTYELTEDGAGYILKKLKTDKADVQIPETYEGKPVVAIGDSALKDNKKIKSVVIPASVKSIGQSAFAGCTALASVSFAEGLSEIGRFAFQNCTALTAISLPASVRSIGKNAFNGCATLSSIAVAAGNTVYRAEGNCLIEIASGTLLRGGKDSVIPADGSVLKIGDYAFAGVSGLIEIALPEGVLSLGYSAFENCISLAKITLPESLERIGWYAFFDCISLLDVRFAGDADAWENVLVDEAGNGRLLSITVQFGK